jgi:hypothetical protein
MTRLFKVGYVGVNKESKYNYSIILITKFFVVLVRLYFQLFRLLFPNILHNIYSAACVRCFFT